VNGEFPAPGDDLTPYRNGVGLPAPAVPRAGDAFPRRTAHHPVESPLVLSA
jgi:hypothetical protein